MIWVAYNQPTPYEEQIVYVMIKIQLEHQKLSMQLFVVSFYTWFILTKIGHFS